MAIRQRGGKKYLFFYLESRLCCNPADLIWPKKKDVTIRVRSKLYALKYRRIGAI